MAGGKEPIEVKFRLFDGTDIGPNKYDPATTVTALKEFVLARWPQDKDIIPKTLNDVKLINAGRILENNKTLAESRVPVGEVPGVAAVVCSEQLPCQLVLDRAGGSHWSGCRPWRRFGRHVGQLPSD
ncbi:hypothetical protein TRIUR3_12104 [Triticum urartu]|uniref:Uncharacterized protein n=1 Tax=Triticum urartu TaxID=4572 RepID=M7ZE95_TRIUA|nr:hypothetical protein TRIUR3_12104 [Triticum urartu]